MALETRHTGSKQDVIDYLRTLIGQHADTAGGWGGGKDRRSADRKHTEQGKVLGLGEAIEVLEKWELTVPPGEGGGWGGGES